MGQTVSVGLTGLSRHVPFVVTGTAVFPAIGDTTELGTGAELTVPGLLRLPPPHTSAPPYNGVVVKFRPGVPLQQGIDSLTARIERLGPYAISGPSTPADLVNFGQLQDLPLLLGLALGLLALLTITHLLSPRYAASGATWPCFAPWDSLAVAVASVPGISACRIRPADALRAE